MKMKGFKKLLVSLGLSAVLTLGLPTAAFASTVTGILASVPEGRETSDIPELSTEQVDNATYVGATSNMVHYNFYFCEMESCFQCNQIHSNA